MRELGDFEQLEHRQIAPILSQVADHIYLVGDAVRYTQDELYKIGMSEDLTEHHHSALTALASLQSFLKKKTDQQYIILCK